MMKFTRPGPWARPHSALQKQRFRTKTPYTAADIARTLGKTVLRVPRQCATVAGTARGRGRGVGRVDGSNNPIMTLLLILATD